MPLLVAGHNGHPSYVRAAAAGAVVVVLLQVLFAQLTLALTACLILLGRLSRWRPAWLLIPAGAGIAWVLVIGPRTAVAGYVTAAGLVLRRVTGPGAAAGLRAILSRWSGWLPAQFPLALVAAAAEASLARRSGLAGRVPRYRAGALVAIRRAYLTASIRHGERATGDGCRIGVVAATGRPAELRWQEAERGVLCTGRERDAVTTAGLDLTLAAIQHRKAVIVVDLGGGAGGAIGSACAAAGAPLRQAGSPGRTAHISLPEALASRQVVLFSPGPAARPAVADLAATLGELSLAGVPEDCLVWINGCEALPPSQLRDLLAAAGRCRGTAIVLGTAYGRAAARIAGQVNVIVLAGPAPAGLSGSAVPGELRDGAADGVRSLFVGDPLRLVRCLEVR